jgi:hypothetical protein
VSYSPEKSEKIELVVQEKAGKAFRTAHRQALNSGLKVHIIDRGNLVGVSPDFRRQVIRPVAGPTKIAKETICRIPPPVDS